MLILKIAAQMHFLIFGSKMNQAQELYWWLVLVVPSFQVMLLS